MYHTGGYAQPSSARQPDYHNPRRGHPQSAERSPGGPVGVGLGLQKCAGGLRVISLVDGQAAQASRQIREGDIVIEVDGLPTHNMGVQEAVSILVGRLGTQVELFIKTDSGNMRKVLLTRGGAGHPGMGRDQSTPPPSDSYTRAESYTSPRRDLSYSRDLELSPSREPPSRAASALASDRSAALLDRAERILAEHGVKLGDLLSHGSHESDAPEPTREPTPKQPEKHEVDRLLEHMRQHLGSSSAPALRESSVSNRGSEHDLRSREQSPLRGSRSSARGSGRGQQHVSFRDMSPPEGPPPPATAMASVYGGFPAMPSADHHITRPPAPDSGRGSLSRLPPQPDSLDMHNRMSIEPDSMVSRNRPLSERASVVDAAREESAALLRELRATAQEWRGLAETLDTQAQEVSLSPRATVDLRSSTGRMSTGHMQRSTSETLPSDIDPERHLQSIRRLDPAQLETLMASQQPQPPQPQPQPHQSPQPQPQPHQSPQPLPHQSPERSHQTATTPPMSQRDIALSPYRASGRGGTEEPVQYRAAASDAVTMSDTMHQPGPRTWQSTSGPRENPRVPPAAAAPSVQEMPKPPPEPLAVQVVWVEAGHAHLDQLVPAFSTHFMHKCKEASGFISAHLLHQSGRIGVLTTWSNRKLMDNAGVADADHVASLVGLPGAQADVVQLDCLGSIWP